MNQIETNLKTCIINAVKQAFDLDWESGDVVIEIPKEKIHGDYSTNAAMRLTKQLRQNPRMIAQQLIDHLDLILYYLSFSALTFVVNFPPVSPEFHQRTFRVHLRNL